MQVRRRKYNPECNPEYNPEYNLEHNPEYNLEHNLEYNLEHNSEYNPVFRLRSQQLSNRLFLSIPLMAVTPQHRPRRLPTTTPIRQRP
jgi:hypothetical protein